MKISYFFYSDIRIFRDDPVYLECIRENICLSLYETIHADQSSSESEVFSYDGFFRYIYFSSCDIHISGCTVLELHAPTCRSNITRHGTIYSDISSGNHEIVLHISFDLDTSTCDYRIISNISLYHELSSGKDEISLSISCDTHFSSSSIEIISSILFDM